MRETVLLDTHALLWYNHAPGLLPGPVRDLLQNGSITVLVSAISALEIAIKFRLGKLPEAAGLVAEYSSTIGRYGFRELPLASSAAIRVAKLESGHADWCSTVGSAF